MSTITDPSRNGLIDADVVRTIWSEADPAHGTHVLLQSAWLSTQHP